jgi:hypothetical protein
MMVTNKLFTYVKDGVEHQCYLQSGRYENSGRLQLELISIDTHKHVASLTREVSSYHNLPDPAEIVAEPAMVDWIVAHDIAEIDLTHRAVNEGGRLYGRFPVMLILDHWRRRFMLA